MIVGNLIGDYDKIFLPWCSGHTVACRSTLIPTLQPRFFLIAAVFARPENHLFRIVAGFPGVISGRHFLKKILNISVGIRAVGFGCFDDLFSFFRL